MNTRKKIYHLAIILVFAGMSCPEVKTNQPNRLGQDNFDFSFLKNINWSDPKTYGSKCDSDCIQLTKDAPSKKFNFDEIGLSKQNYYGVKIKGDGSCWVRATFLQLLFYALKDQKNFSTLKENINKAKEEFVEDSGFTNRFKADELIKFLEQLYLMTPKERIETYNKKNVDLFLDYSFRALIYAIQDKKGIRDEKLLNAKSFGDYYNAYQELSLYLLPDHNIVLLELIDINNPRLVVRKKNGIRQVLDVRLSKKLVDDYNKCIKQDCYDKSLEELEQMANELRLIIEEHPDNKNKLRMYDAAIVCKKILRQLGITDISKIYEGDELKVLAYREYEGHAAIVVRKDASLEFGYTQKN